jgi:putative membrane protein
MTTEQFLISAWNWNPIALLVSGAALIGYFWAFGAKRRLAYLVAGIGVFLLTLTSPINALAGGYLFSAHMLQHILLLLIVPALVLMSLPRSVSLDLRPRFLSHPLIGWSGGVGAMWLWHARTLCDAAVSSRPVYALQTVSLLVLGAFFWRQVIAPREEERLSPPGAVLYLFGACIACSILGILITFSPVSVCPIYTRPLVDRFNILQTIRSGWGFTPEKDQQVGGLLMWVPMCLVYLGAIFAQIARWFAEPVPNRSAQEQAL